MTLEGRPIAQLSFAMSTLRHASNGMLFRLTLNVNPVSLHLPMSECLVLPERLFGRIIKSACGTRMLSMIRGFYDLGTHGLGVGLLQVVM